MEDQEAQLVLDEEVEETSEEEFKEEGLLPQEIDAAKSLGLIKKDEHEKQSKPDPKEDSEEKKEVEENHPTFEEVDKDKNLLKKYNKNEQALYWKYKADRRKRQEAEERYEELKAELELGGLKGKAYEDKIQKVVALLKDESKELTAGEILKILDLEESKEEKKKEDPAVKQQQYFAKRVSFIEEMGRAQYEDFDHIVELAQEVVKESPRHKKRLEVILSDDSIDPQEVINEVIEVAQSNPKYKSGKEASPEVKAKVEKAIKNSEKKVSSASVSSGGAREVLESQLTVEQASRLSNEQWRKLKPETKKRLLMGINP